MNKNCLRDVLKVITVLQNNASDDCEENNSCTRPFLGNFPETICFNTRIVTFYRCDNSLITLPYTLDGTTSTTTIFRVENVSDNAVVVLLLQDNGDGTYTNTNTYATINLGCICAIRCTNDTTITNV